MPERVTAKIINNQNNSNGNEIIRNNLRIKEDKLELNKIGESKFLIFETLDSKDILKERTESIDVNTVQ